MHNPLLEVATIAGDPGRKFRQIVYSELSDIQTVTPRRTGVFRRHIHRDCELIMPCSGVYRCMLNQTDVTVGPGEFLLIQPGQLHQDYFQVSVSFRCVHFKIYEAASRELPIRLFAPETPPDKQRAAFPNTFARELADRLYKAGEEGFSQLVQNGLFQALFWLLLEAFPVEFFFRKLEKCTENNNVMLYITDCFENALKVGRLPPGMLEKKLALSTRSLNRLCHTLFNAPPHRAFQTFRIQCVRQFMLANPGIGVKEVAERFHYANAFHLSRLFRHAYGYPPSRLTDRLDSVCRRLQIEKS